MNFTTSLLWGPGHLFCTWWNSMTDFILTVLKLISTDSKRKKNKYGLVKWGRKLHWCLRSRCRAWPQNANTSQHTPTVICSTIVTIKHARADGKTPGSLRQTIDRGVIDNCIGLFLLVLEVQRLWIQYSSSRVTVGSVFGFFFYFTFTLGIGPQEEKNIKEKKRKFH